MSQLVLNRCGEQSPHLIIIGMEAQEIRALAVDTAVRMGVLAQDLIKVASEIEAYIIGKPKK